MRYEVTKENSHESTRLEWHMHFNSVNQYSILRFQDKYWCELQPHGMSVYTGILEQVDAKPMLKTLKQPEFRWPVVGDGLGGDYQWSAAQWSLLKTLAEIRNQHSKSVLIRLYVSPDDRNSSQYIIKVRHLQDFARKHFHGTNESASGWIFLFSVHADRSGVLVSLLQRRLHHQHFLCPGCEFLLHRSPLLTCLVKPPFPSAAFSSLLER